MRTAESWGYLASSASILALYGSKRLLRLGTAPREAAPIRALERPCARNSEVAGKSSGRRVSRSRPSGEFRPTNPPSWPTPLLVRGCRRDGPAQDIAQLHQPPAGLGPAALASGRQGKDLG